MREELNQKKIDSWQGILYVLGIVLLVAVISFAMQFVAYILKMQVITIISFVGIVVVATLLIKKRLQNYAYIIDRGNMGVERSTGNNRKLLAEFHIKDIVWHGPLAELPEEYKNVSHSKLTFLPLAGAYGVVYRDLNGFMRRIAISPSDAFIGELKARQEKIRERAEKKQAAAERAARKEQEENQEE